MTLSQRADLLAECIGADWNEGWREKKIHDEAMKQFHAIIEECARAVKAQHRSGDSVNVGLALDRAEAAIRALKDKP